MMGMANVVGGGKSTGRDCESEEKNAFVDGKHYTMSVVGDVEVFQKIERK
jgi:hypothetical protein